jgi:hypothetical protein
MTKPHPPIESLSLNAERMDQLGIPSNQDAAEPLLAVSMSDIERTISEREMLCLDEIGGHMYRNNFGV